MKRAAMRITWANLRRSLSLLPDDVKILYGQTDGHYDGVLLVLEGDGLPDDCKREHDFTHLLFVRPRMKTIRVAEVVNIVGAGLLRVDESGETEGKPGVLAACGPPFDLAVFTGW